MRTTVLSNMTKAEVRPVGLADPVPDWLFGFGLFLLALLLRLACFTGLIASDDLDYSAYAQLIAEGRYAPKYHHVAIRYGLILPAGLLYGLIGVSEWSTITVPLFASSLSVVLLALIAARLFGVRTGLIAALLLATFRYSFVTPPRWSRSRLTEWPASRLGLDPFIRKHLGGNPDSPGRGPSGAGWWQRTHGCASTPPGCERRAQNSSAARHRGARRLCRQGASGPCWSRPHSMACCSKLRSEISGLMVRTPCSTNVNEQLARLFNVPG